MICEDLELDEGRLLRERVLEDVMRWVLSEQPSQSREALERLKSSATRYLDSHRSPVVTVLGGV